MGGLLDGHPRCPAYDEMFRADELPHPHPRALYDAPQTLTGVFRELAATLPQRGPLGRSSSASAAA